MSPTITFPEKSSVATSPTSEGFPASNSPTETRIEPERNSSGGSNHSRPKVGKERSLDTHYDGPVIPPSTKQRKKHRTVVLCFDGTGDQFDNDNSNVVNFFALLKKGEPKQQLVYYQAGIGTYTVPQIASPIKSRISKTIDMMVGSSLHHHVMGGYEFLMENYHTGDKICILGFSRGAYTARALAGMIEKVGLLPAGNRQQIPFAYKMYMKDTEFGWKQSVLFKKTFSMDVDIEFVGVWDTVDSVGIISRHVPFTKYNACVKTFRHAISLDERRAKFKPNLYDKFFNEDNANNEFSLHQFRDHIHDIHEHIHEHNEQAKKRAQKMWAKVRNSLKAVSKVTKRADKKYTMAEKLAEEYTDSSKDTDVLEVWFAGCHTDVGGGSVTNDTRHCLARIPLRWMIRQCFLTNSGIQFQADRLRSIGLDPNMLWPTVKERPPPMDVKKILKPSCIDEAKNGLYKCEDCPMDKALKGHDCSESTNASTSDSRDRDDGSFKKSPGVPEDDEMDQYDIDALKDVVEEHEELHDALSPMFDQLSLRWPWWLLELLPLVHRVQRHDGTNEKVLSINHGRPRKYKRQTEKGIKVHRSVKLRMEAEHLLKPYEPRLKFEVEPEWVD